MVNKTTKKALGILAEKTMKNRPIALRLMNDPEFNRRFIQGKRDDIARRIRESRNKLKGR